MGEKTISDFITYLTMVKVNGQSMDEFIYYDASFPLSTLSYDNVRGEKGGIILLVNDDSTATIEQQRLFYTRDGENAAIRSKWHNTTSVKKIVPLIEQEVEYLKDNDYKSVFRVNQAQLTPDFLGEPLKTIFDWSLINIAAISNIALLNNNSFEKWIKQMPIFMVDFADSNNGSFNSKINKRMIDYNKAL